uniref:S2-locus F-box type-2 protein n=1 Tax=Petunia integrifolia subsp. inflata TaxID=212142 RepID=A0A076YJP4_PETIN|nr:S2-locus F-box type-2 protein [Petunia integrifolia subsp. inflata]
MATRIMKKLPEDVVIYILLRFAVKSLLRFKCISKAWYSLIITKTFVKLYGNRITTTKDEFILCIRTFREEPEQLKSIASFFSCDDNNDLNTLAPDVDVSDLTSSCDTIFNQLIGPCHGLIALTDSFIIIILNPSTRKYVVLPPSPFGCPKGYHRSIEGIGFGFDSIVNDYKVVRLSDVYWDPPTDYPGPREPKVDIFDLSIDSWRELDLEFPTIYYLPCSEMYYKEAIHWFIIAETVVILCFDISTETFRTMKMPGTCTLFDGPRYGLSVLNEHLTLICYPDPMSSIDPTEDLIDIWMMEEYGASESWIKIYTIRPVPIPIESPLAIWKGHLLLLQTKSGFLVSCDLNSGDVKEFNLNGHLESLRVLVYTETLTTIQKISEHGTQVQQF